jgi:hypothetical protein
LSYTTCPAICHIVLYCLPSHLSYCPTVYCQHSHLSYFPIPPNQPSVILFYTAYPAICHIFLLRLPCVVPSIIFFCNSLTFPVKMSSVNPFPSFLVFFHTYSRNLLHTSCLSSFFHFSSDFAVFFSLFCFSFCFFLPFFPLSASPSPPLTSFWFL